MFDFKQLLVDSGIIVHWNNQNRWISYVIWALKLRKPRKFTISRVAESQYTNFLLVVMAHIQWHHVSALNLNRHGFCPCWFNFEAIGRLVSRVKFVGHRLLEPRVLVEDHWPMTRSPLIWNICVFICKNWYFDNGRVQSRFLSTWYQSPIILRGSMSRFAIGGPLGAKFNDMSHFGPFLRVSIEGWPQFTRPPWKI